MTQDSKIIEREFLSILILRPKIGFDLLQIKPKYLSVPIHSLIFEASIQAYKDTGVIDISQLVSYNRSITYDVITDVITEEYLPITDVRKQFLACQVAILNNHKKRVINNLTTKLNDKQITCEEYLAKMSVINEVTIYTGADIITEEELVSNIRTEQQQIELKNYPTLSKDLKLVHGDFLLIGGSTGTGKSAVLLNLMNDLMDRYQCIYFNMEMSKSTIYKRMVSIKSDVPISCIEHDTSDYQKQLIDSAVQKITENKVVVEHKATYLSEIKSVIKMLKNDKKHTILFLDHVGLIRLGSGKSQYEQMTEIAKQLRQICLDYDCTIIGACQLNRSSYSSDELSISMLKDSGELENSSSKVILLYRDKEDKRINEKSPTAKMILEIVKNRDGMLSKVYCDYDKTKQIFKERIN